MNSVRQDLKTESPTTSHQTFTFLFDNNAVTANEGDTVAAALIANNIRITRTTALGTQRGPYCMMGACYDCLIELDGVTVQACMTAATPGLEVFSANRPADD